MLLLLRRWLHRYRWPVILGLVVFVGLWYLLQPRPYAHTTLRDKALQQALKDDYATYSPSGRYILVRCLLQDAVLLDVSTSRVLFTTKLEMSSNYRFDSADCLVYSTTDNWKEVQLYRWEPGLAAPVKVLTRPAFIPNLDGHETLHSMAFEGVADLTDNLTRNAFLSPDASMWLVPARNKDAIQLELIDAHTGAVQHQLPITIQATTREKVKPRCEVAFSHDSKLLLVQYARENQFKRLVHSLLMVDVKTGKTLWESTLPEKTKFDKTLFFTPEHIMGWNQVEETGHACLQEFSPQHGWKRTLLKETVADPFEYTSHGGDELATKAQVELEFDHDATSNKIVYCWKHTALAGALGGGMPYLPGYYYGLRDAANGQLLRSQRLPDRSRDKDDSHEEGWKVLELLPGPNLLLMGPRPDIYEHPPRKHPEWKKTLDAWREQYTPSLPSLLRDETYLITLNAATGVMSDRFRLGIQNYVKAHYLPQCQSVFVTYDQDGMIHILQYRYPFQKPWLLILSIVAGFIIVLITLQLLLAGLRQLRTAKKT